MRDYDSVEFAAEKRFADNWYLRTSYLWSRLYGNYSGLSQSDENGRTSPNVGRLWDYPMMMFQDGGIAASSDVWQPIARTSSRPQFIYQFNFGTSMGVNQFVASGLPVSREIGIYPTNNLPVNYLGRMSDGRTPTFSQTDMLVQHRFRIGGGRQLQVSFNILNLFNQDTAVVGELDLPQAKASGQRCRRPMTRGCSTAGQQTLEQLIVRAEHRPESDVPDGQRLPGADPGAVRREVHLLNAG